jgi:hypothetical protein
MTVNSGENAPSLPKIYRYSGPPLLRVLTKNQASEYHTRSDNKSRLQSTLPNKK